MSYNPFDDPWISWVVSGSSQSSSDLLKYYSEQSNTSNWDDFDLHPTSLDHISPQTLLPELSTSQSQSPLPFGLANFQTLEFLSASNTDAVPVNNGTHDPMANLGTIFPEPTKLPSFSQSSFATASTSQPSRSTSSSASATAASPVPTTNTAKSGRKRALSLENDAEAEAAQADRRRRNNAAAAKYRQKKIDRIAELEKALEEVSKERDGLKMQLAKKDAEAELLRSLLAKKG